MNGEAQNCRQSQGQEKAEVGNVQALRYQVNKQSLGQKSRLVMEINSRHEQRITQEPSSAAKVRYNFRIRYHRNTN